MIYFISIIIVLAACIPLTAFIVDRRKSRDSDTDNNLLARLGEYQKLQIDEIRKGYAEQKEEMRADFDRRLAGIQAESDKRAEAMRQEFDRRTEHLRQLAREQSETMRREIAEEYKSLSQQILDSNSEKLKKTNLEQIDNILTPLKERIQEFSQTVIDSYTKENAARQSLTDQIGRLMELNRTIGEEARNLTRALSTDSKKQGDWGENILTTLLEQAGLQKGIHFDEQLTRDERGNVLRDEDGKGMRPDVVVHLPDRKNLIIDSKVSLTAFAAYHSTDDAQEKEQLARKHLASVKRHIKEPGEKEYQKRIADAAEHVLMFIPVENAYLMAMQADPELWKYAYDLHVAIVSPTHLFSVMQIVTQLWSQDARNRNALKIAECGGKIYDKLCGFTDDFLKIRKSLDSASASCDNAFKKLSSGRGNIIGMAENIRTLGARVKKSLPEEIISAAEIEEADTPDILADSAQESRSLEKKSERDSEIPA